MYQSNLKLAVTILHRLSQRPHVPHHRALTSCSYVLNIGDAASELGGHGGFPHVWGVRKAGVVSNGAGVITSFTAWHITQRLARYILSSV